jgi:hypothetical protein
VQGGLDEGPSGLAEATSDGDVVATTATATANAATRTKPTASDRSLRGPLPRPVDECDDDIDQSHHEGQQARKVPM